MSNLPVIGEYRMIRKLGGGGFGTVHLAEHIHEHSQVAIKILRVPLTKSEDFRDFLNETRTMIRLRHPYIIPLLDVGLSREDLPFLVMEYASEGTLRDRHPKGSQLPLATIVKYVEQIASALQYAHDHRIIHRDVKPANMLLRTDGTLLLSDFGIAKIIEQNTLISMQTQIGTPAYMAPEQHMGHPCFASDQYALATVAYEWISGTLPFQGSSLGLVAQHMTALPPPLLSLLPTLHPTIEQVILKALSKAPEQRFASIQEFATALCAAVQQSTVPQIETKQPPLDAPLSKEALIPQSSTNAPKHNTPPSIGGSEMYEVAQNPYANASYNPYSQPPQPGNIPPYGQLPQAPSYTSPPQPNTLPAYGSLQSGNIPYGPPFVAQPVKPKGKAGLITGTIIAILAIIIVGGTILAMATQSLHTTSTGSSGNTVTSPPTNTYAFTPTPTPTPIPTSTTAITPSGQPIDSTASSIVRNIQMASAIDITSAQPTALTTSFKTYIDIYSTFQFNFNNTNVTLQNPGYVEAKYYIANSRILTADPLKIDDSTIPGGYFKVQYYRATTAGAVELYWCRQPNCSDEKLAQTASFTVS